MGTLRNCLQKEQPCPASVEKQQDFNRKYPFVAAALGALPDETVIDGEIVALDGSGWPSFNLLQNYELANVPIQYYLFGVLLFLWDMM